MSNVASKKSSSCVAHLDMVFSAGSRDDDDLLDKRDGNSGHKGTCSRRLTCAYATQEDGNATSNTIAL